MSSIQKKILTLSAIVVFIMSIIWAFLVYYNQKTQAQYDEILQRYLRMNEVSGLSQETVSDLNDYLLEPSERKRADLQITVGKLDSAKLMIEGMRNSVNEFTLLNYMNLMESLGETAKRSIMFYEQDNEEEAAVYFAEATRISKYISETTLTLINKELHTYDAFYRGIIAQSSDIKKLGFLVLVLATIILLLFTYWFSHSISKPIQRLTQAAKELSRGRFDRKIDIESNDEIAFLARTFDRMRVNINNLISEIQQKAQLESELQANKLLLKESQLRSLQSQINPHFLFNTLDTLSKKAFMEGSMETSDLIANVANLLRYNLKQLDRAVTLKDELNVLLQYIEIQKTRFTERLNFQLEVDEKFMSLRMPCLTLQPIIENAVIHAVEPLEEGGTIYFRVVGCDGYVRIEIEDNGIGIAEEKLARVMDEGSQMAMESHSTGIGFSNVVRRLRLFYGRDDVISISSTVGVGTKVTLRLPIGGGVVSHV